MPRTISITQGLAQGFSSVRDRKSNNKKEVIETIKVDGVDSFSADAAYSVVKAFVKEHEISNARKPAFLTYKPEIKDISNVTFIVENKYQEDVIKDFRGGLVKSLKQKLNNKNIEIFTRIVEAKEAKRLLVTDKQRYDYLLEKYPALDKLRQTFDLDLQ